MSDKDGKESRQNTGRRKRPAQRRHPDIEVARLLVKRGFLDKAIALSALKEQRARAQEKQPRIPFVQLLVRKKMLPAQKLNEIHDELRRHTYLCPSCDARAVLVPSSQAEGAACPRCGSAIALDAPSAGAEAPPAEFNSARDALLAPPGVDKFSQGSLAFGRYEILSEIGRGAMGVVYRARHKTLNKEVALKVLLTGEDAREAQVARFRREAAAVQKLRHDGIVAVHDFGAEGEVYFLTMELVPGGLTLHKLWKDPERAPELKTRLSHLAQVAKAIDYANRRGVIHRDLKPANVLLAPEGAALVADFGLAKDESDELGLTRSEDRLGTPLFMAPEQVRAGSSEVDNRVDVWALGVMTFVGVTGRYPFRGKTIMDLYMKILNEDPDWTGEFSEVPDRDFGQAPKPSEVRSIERKRRVSETRTRAIGDPDLEATEVASYALARQAKKTSGPRATASVASPPPFVPPRDLQGKDVPRDLRMVIEMALAKDPDRRYESAGELAKDLERYLAGEPVLARPPGKLGRTWRRLKRHRALVALALVLFLAPLAVFLEHARRAAAEEKAHAEEAEALAKKKAQREADARAASEVAERVWAQVLVEEKNLAVYERAASELQDLSQKYPDTVSPILKQGLAHAFAIQRPKAAAALAKARALLGAGASLPVNDARSGLSLAQVLGDAKAQVELARLGLQGGVKDDALSLGLARALLALGKLDEAQATLEPLLAQGTTPRAHAVAAEVALAKKDLAAALDHADSALRESPQDPEAHAIRGLVGLAKGEQQAAEHLARARGARDREGFKAPPEVLYFYHQGRDLRFLKPVPKPELAAEADAFAASIASWSPVPSFWRADVRWRDLHDLAGAIDDYDECLQRDPAFVEAAEIRADLLLASRDAAGLARAEKSFRAEIERAPSDRARCDLALVLLSKGDLDGALAELAPVKDAENAHELLLAEVERRRGDEAAAARHLSAWSSKRSGTRAARDLLALARARLHAKDGALALEAVQRALKAFDGDPKRTGFLRPASTVLIAHALEAAAQALLGNQDRALAALAKAAGRSELAPEILPDALKVAPELASLRDNAAFQKLLESRKREGPDED